MIRAEGLSFRYAKSSYVFRGVSVDICDGCLIALIGPNGVGKSTLVKCLAGLLDADEGYVGIDGVDIRRMSPRQVSSRVSVVAQETVPPSLSVYDAVLAGRLPRSPIMPRHEDRDIVIDALKVFGLTGIAESPCTRVSGGELRRVLLARAYVQETKNLLLDEPLNGLDFRARHETMKLVLSLAHEAGNAVFAVMHDLDIALRYCDGFVAINHEGCVSNVLSPSELTGPMLSGLYGVECFLENANGRMIVELA